MKLGVVAVDYDGTLTLDGRLSRDTIEAIGRVRAGGVRVVLVTGRRLAHLAGDAELALFDAVVAENGAVLEFPASGRKVRLGEPCPRALIDALHQRGIEAVGGECLIETHADRAPAVLETLRALEQPHGLAFNRGRLMILPPGVAKSTGLRHALFELRASPHNTVGIGDAENDHDLLSACELGVAVRWGSPALCAVADEVIDGSGPEAVAAYLRGIATQARLPVGRSRRHRIPLGTLHSGEPLTLAVRGRTVIVAGEPGSGKSQIAGVMCEQFILQGYSLAVLDPEGDYRALESMPNVTVTGGAVAPPAPREVLHALRHPGETLVIDLSRLDAADKRHYVRTVLPLLAGERRRGGLPHKIVLDEAHQFLAAPDTAALVDPELGGYIWVTYRVSHLDPAVCAEDAVRIVTRESEADEIDALSRLCGAPLDRGVLRSLPQDEAVLLPGPDEAAGGMVRFKTGARLTAHVRHRQKYFDMPVADAQAFVFTNGGQSGGRARSFKEMVALLGTETPRRVRGHCERHDVSRWVRDVFRDGILAARLEEIEAGIRGGDPRIVADGLAQAIRARYDVYR